MKLCTNCRNHLPPTNENLFDMCKAPQLTERGYFDYVTGQYKQNKVFCQIERKYDAPNMCGISGQWFVQRLKSV